VAAQARWLQSAHPLCRELIEVRERSVWELRRDPRKDIPYLERIAQRVLHDADELSQYERVTRVLELAIPRLTDERQQRAASLLFGLDGPHRRAQLNQRQRAAASVYDISSDGFRDNRYTSGQHEQTLIRELADALLSLAKASRDSHRFIPEELFGHVPYVKRPELEAQFAKAVSEDHSVIAFIGDIGVGKSKLAYELAFRQAKRPVNNCWVRAYDEALTIKDISAALFQHGVDTSGVDATAMLKLKFAQLMQRTDSPEFVVFDGVTDANDLDSMLLPGMQSTVIVTSTRALPSESVRQIVVPDMSDEEARELVGTLIEFIPPDSASLITEVAGNRPRVLVQACHLLTPSSRLDPDDIARGLRTSPQVFLMLAESNWRQRLSRRYEQLLAELHDEHRPAQVLLVLIAVRWYNGPHPMKSTLEFLFGTVLKLDSSLVPVAFRQAVDVLVTHNVITDGKEGIVINPLVQALIFDLMRGSAYEVIERICVALEAEIAGTEPIDSLYRVEASRLIKSGLLGQLRQIQRDKPLKPRYGSDFFLLRAITDEDVLYSRKGGRPQAHRVREPYMSSWLIDALVEVNKQMR
jgi:hypothetical protein